MVSCLCKKKIIINNDLEVEHPIWKWKSWFLRSGENPSTRRKSFRSKGENQPQTHPHMASTQGFEPGQHWLEGSANLLLPIMGCDCSEADLGFLIGGGEKGLLYAFGV